MQEQHLKNRLLTLKQNVTHRINSIDKDIRHEGMSADWTEQAVERENDEVLESLGNNAKQELAMIKLALKRIESGEYFYCQSCGEKIPAARLEVLPFNSLCIDCADKLENDHRLNNVKRET
jgi:DnaK suppressor protein